MYTFNGPSFGSYDSYYVIEIHSDASGLQSYSKIAFDPDEPNRLFDCLTLRTSQPEQTISG